MKDELQGHFIKEFVGIGPKNYTINSLITQKDKSIKLTGSVRCKGIGKAFVPRFEEYKKCIFEDSENTVSKECFRINSKDH